MSLSHLSQSRFHRRRTMLGVPLVLHLLWIAAITGAPAVAAQHPATLADTVAMTATPTGDAGSGDLPHCHDMVIAESALPPVDEAPANPSHAPCCAEQCHCASALCAVLLPAHPPVPLPAVSASLPLNGASETDRAPPERHLRPPILS
jgi:hypothetical protein